MADIPGWFGFEKWYDRVAADCPEGATLVELGVFCGKSLAYLANAVRGKGCRVVGVDTFLGSPEFEKVVHDWRDVPIGQLAQIAVRHLHDAGVLRDVTLIVSDSAKAAGLFPDESVWSVFVDAGHDADSVERDVRAWWPKVARGGWLAGDDLALEYPGVAEGLRRYFPPELLPPEPKPGESLVWIVGKS